MSEQKKQNLADPSVRKRFVTYKEATELYSIEFIEYLKRKCYVYNLMVKDNVDEWIHKLLEAKQYAAFLAQGDINKLEYRAKAD